jgi:ABC-2 type transport system permease protein
MKKVFVIGWVNTVRFMRERANLFFVFAFPLLIILLLGASFGGGFETRLGAHVAGNGGPLAEQLLTRLDGLEDIQVVVSGSEDELIDGVQRGRLTGGLIIPADYDPVLTSTGTTEVVYVGSPADEEGQLLAVTVQEALAAETAPVRIARFVVSRQGGDLAEVADRASSIIPLTEQVEVSFREAGEPLFEGFEDLGAFDLGASQQLILFTFLTSLAGSAALIQTRRLGVARRMLSTSTPTRVIVGGEATGRFVVAMIQGLYIMIGTRILFGVDWGHPIGAVAVLVVFSLVGAGAAMLMGALFHNDQQAGGLGVLFALGLAALGGCMVPIEIFPDTMQTIAKLTPHAWGLDAFAELVRRDGTVIDILPQLGVLVAFVAVLFALATWRLQRVLTE